MIDYQEYIEDHTLRCEASYRGGGIEIDVTDLFGIQDDELYKMTAYQNYLGGGLLGCISSDCNFNPSELGKRNWAKFEKMNDELKRYFHALTNHEGDEWEEQTYEQNQGMPVSAY